MFKKNNQKDTKKREKFKKKCKKTTIKSER